MKSRCFLALAAALLGGAITLATSRAADPDPEAVKAASALIDSMDMENLLTKSLETSLDTQMKQFSQMGIPAAGVAELKSEMLAFMKEVMAWEDLRPEFVRIYAESFTAAELNELTAFYQTPTGRKAASVMPDLMSKGMILGQEKVQARAAELQQRIMPIIQRHMAPQ